MSETRQPAVVRALPTLLRPIRGRVVLALVGQAVSVVVGIVPFVVVAEIGRVLLLPGPLGDAGRAAVWTLAAVGIGALLVRLVFLTLSAAVIHFADNELQLRIRRDLAQRLGGVPLGWFIDRDSGSVKKALQDDVTALHHLVAHGLNDLVSAILTPLLVFGFLVWVDWRMALVTALPLAVGVALYGWAMTGYANKMVAYDKAIQRVNASAVEFVQGIAVVKTFGQAGQAHRKFTRAADDFASFFLGWARSTAPLSTASEIALSPVVVLLTVLAGGTVFVVNGWLPGVEMLPFALLSVAVTAPALSLSYNVYELRTARMAAERIIALGKTPELPVAPAPQSADSTRVVFEDVSFSYDGAVDALREFSATLEPGTVTALVGRSGSGKTTVARLLPRFWDVTSGAITIGGADIRELAPAELYRLVGFVFQDVQLLRTSVADNIRLARPGASLADVEAAARAAQIHERITQLSMGYEALVGVDAVFSGGEAQRVSIARALLADPALLVLDEATAFADPESEALIQEAISTLVRGRTLLVIAHRLSTVVDADQILVLDGGHIVERGHHAELVAAGGTYAKQWAAHERTGRWQPHASPLAVDATEKESRR